MSDMAEQKCADCTGVMRDIEILDKTVQTVDFNMKFIGWNIPLQAELEYAIPESKRSWWTGSLPIAGKVAALMCENCGRIALFGRPKSTDAS